MGFTGYTIDDSITRVGGGTILVPEGEYLLSIAGVEPSPEDHNGVGFFRWSLRIKEGPGGIGRSFRHTTTMMGDTQWGLGSLLNALGQLAAAEQLKGTVVPNGPEGYKVHCAIGERLKGAVGREIGALVVTGSYNGKERSEISEFYPAADYAERSKSNALPKGAGSPPQAVNGNGATSQIAAGVAPTATGGGLDLSGLESFFKD